MISTTYSSNHEKFNVWEYIKSPRPGKDLASDTGAGYITPLCPLDACARETGKTSFDPKFAMEKPNLLRYLRNGATHLGDSTGHGMVSQSFVRPISCFTASTDVRNSYQEVQHLSPIETAIRYLPNIAAGSILNILTGLIVHRVAVNYYVVIISALCSISPLLMAIIHVDWSWWLAGFWVNFLLPISVDGNSLHYVSC